jgi:hypothetical protein
MNISKHNSFFNNLFLALRNMNSTVCLQFNKAEGQIFTGVGKIGITKKFRWDEISSITEVQSLSCNSRRTESIQMEGQRRICFAAMVKTERKYFMKMALQEMLIRIKP